MVVGMNCVVGGDYDKGQSGRLVHTQKLSGSRIDTDGPFFDPLLIRYRSYVYLQERYVFTSRVAKIEKRSLSWPHYKFSLHRGRSQKKGHLLTLFKMLPVNRGGKGNACNLYIFFGR